MQNFELDAMLNMFPLLLKYLHITLSIALIALIIALVISLMLSIIRVYKIKGLYTLSNLYVSFFRGTPMLVQLFLLYFGLPQVIPIFKNVTAYNAAIIGLSLNSAAYMSETIRAAIVSVDKGQMEASLSVGMTHFQGMKRIVLPQAARVAIPSLANNFIDLIKGSSLAFTIGVAEIMAKAQMNASATYRFFESYLAVAIVYWITISFFSYLQKLLEIKLNRAY